MDPYKRRSYKAERHWCRDVGNDGRMYHYREQTASSRGGKFSKKADRDAVHGRMVQLCELIFETDWWKAHGVHVPEIGRSTIGSAFYSPWTRGVYFSVYASLTDASVVAHELAHAVAPGGHGARWAAAYIEILRMVLGDWQAHLLEAHFHEVGVPIDYDRFGQGDQLTMPLYDVIAVEHGFPPVSTAGEQAAARKARTEALPLGAEDFEQPALFAA